MDGSIKVIATVALKYNLYEQMIEASKYIEPTVPSTTSPKWINTY